MFNIDSFNQLNKEQYYESLYSYAQGLLEGERDLTANLANVSSLIYHTMPDINWAGFYLLKKSELVLGPFGGKPACIRIPIGKGVCGSAVYEGKTQRVEDVHQYPGHIACDSDTNSEIVIPIMDKKILGVLDIDSPVKGRFDKKDQVELEKLANLLLNACDWEENE